MRLVCKEPSQYFSGLATYHRPTDLNRASEAARHLLAAVHYAIAWFNLGHPFALNPRELPRLEGYGAPRSLTPNEVDACIAELKRAGMLKVKKGELWLLAFGPNQAFEVDDWK